MTLKTWKKRPQKLLIIGPQYFFQYCQKRPGLPRQLKTHTVFSMFPIHDTNLCLTLVFRTTNRWITKPTLKLVHHTYFLIGEYQLIVSIVLKYTLLDLWTLLIQMKQFIQKLFLFPPCFVKGYCTHSWGLWLLWVL